MSKFFKVAFLICFTMMPFFSKCEKYLNTKTHTLKNGIQIVVYEHNRSPLVLFMVCVGRGSADDPHGKSGLAHYSEHLMFKGTKQYPSGELEKTMQRIGAVFNAFTCYDQTVYWEFASKEHLETLIKIESDRFCNDLIINKDSFEKERDVVKEERRLRIDSKDDVLLNEQVWSSLFKSHPYGVPIAGWMDEVAKLTLEDALEYRKNYYVPENIKIVVCGDVKFEEAVKLVENYFSKFNGPKKIERQWTKIPPNHGAQVKLIKKTDQTEQPVLTVHWIEPVSNRNDPKTAAAIEILFKCLAEGSTSRFYRNLVEIQKVASRVNSSCSSFIGNEFRFFRDPAALSIEITPALGITIENLETALMIELKKAAIQGVSENEVEKAKKRILARLIYSKDDLEQTAFILASMLSSDYSLDFIESWPKYIEETKLEDVNAIAKKLLPDIRVISVLVPKNNKGENQ